jgi:hypothetical protein
MESFCHQGILGVLGLAFMSILPLTLKMIELSLSQRPERSHGYLIDFWVLWCLLKPSAKGENENVDNFVF